jgi:hypothetical protein
MGIRRARCLSSLVLSRNRIDHRAMAIITDILVGFRTGGATDDAGAAAFGDEATDRCPLANCLTDLDLSHNSLGPQGAAAIARMLAARTGPHRLRRLCLASQSAAFGPEGASKLAASMTASLTPVGRRVGR